MIKTFFLDDIPFVQDEIDALASSRAADGDNSTHEGVITSLLNEMDGVQELQGVTIIAATNRPEIIVCEFPSKRRGIENLFAQDSALMRPGRFDRALYVGPPDQAGREEILKIRIKNMAVDPDIDIVEIARLVCSLVFSHRSWTNDLSTVGRLFRSRNVCALSRSCNPHHAKRYERSLCKI